MPKLKDCEIFIVIKFRGIKTLVFINFEKINIYYYNSNLIRSAGSRQVDRHESIDPRLSTRRDPALRIKLLLK